MADDWISVDKLQHLAMCFFIVILFAYTIRIFLTPSRFLYRWATPVGCILSVNIRVAKELGDEMGIRHSAGGSLKDGLADPGCVVLVAALLHFSKPNGAQRVYDKALELKGPIGSLRTQRSSVNTGNTPLASHYIVSTSI